MAPNLHKSGSREHIYAHLCDSFSYSDNFLPHDSQGRYKSIINPNDLEMILEYIFFSACPFLVTFSSQNCVKIKILLSFDFAKGTIEYIFKTGYKKYKNDYFL